MLMKKLDVNKNKNQNLIQNYQIENNLIPN